MLRLDSSEMLPGSQEGEETTSILKPHDYTPPFWLNRSGGRCNDHVTRAVKPRDVNKRAWMPCHVLRLRIGTTTQGSRPSPTLAFSSFHRSASAPIIICCSLYFLERALSLLFFSDSETVFTEGACARTRSAMFVYSCPTWSTCDRVTHNFGKIPQRCSSRNRPK